METPRVIQIKNGWAAIGNGWAIHAPTKEEALQRYEEAERHHREIESRPYFYEQKAREREATRAPGWFCTCLDRPLD